MLNYYRILLECKDLTPEEMLLERYNPFAVEFNFNTFKKKAEENGFKVKYNELDNKFDRPKDGFCSFYPTCIKGNYTCKVRVSDHEHDKVKTNDVSVEIVSDKRNGSAVMDAIDLLNQKYTLITDNLDIIKQRIKTKDFVVGYLDLYRRENLRGKDHPQPEDFLDLLKLHKLPEEVKNLDWFKEYLKKLCQFVAGKSRLYQELYNRSKISKWDGGLLRYY